MEHNITVYSTQTCGFCTMAKQYLDEKGFKYNAVDVTFDREKQKEMIDKSGQMGVPVLDIDGQIIVGFDKTRIDQLLSTPVTSAA